MARHVANGRAVNAHPSRALGLVSSKINLKTLSEASWASVWTFSLLSDAFCYICHEKRSWRVWLRPRHSALGIWWRCFLTLARTWVGGRGCHFKPCCVMTRQTQWHPPRKPNYILSIVINLWPVMMRGRSQGFANVSHFPIAASRIRAGNHWHLHGAWFPIYWGIPNIIF